MLNQGDGVVLHVLDNASKDGTREWLLEKAKRHSNLKLTVREENIGALANYQSAFDSVDTEFCIPLASDDELLPGFVGKALAAAKKDETIGAVVFQTECRRDGRKPFLNPSAPTPGRRNRREHLLEWTQSGHYFSWSSILWRTDTLRKASAPTEFARFPFAGDAWVQFRCFLHAPVYMVAEAGAVLNMHEHQASRSIGAGAVGEVATMLREIEVLLRDANLLSSEHELSCLITKLYEHWARVLKWGLRKANRQFSDSEIHQAMNEYLGSFAPRVGFKEFAILPMFDEYRKITADSSAYKVKWMENSLSWKITKPLRMLASALNCK